MLRTKLKIQDDLAKSKELVRRLRLSSRFGDYNFRILLVTFSEPTADQNEVVRSSKTGCPREIISFGTLFSRLFNARHYLRTRESHSFGSVRNPSDENDIRVPANSYIPTALIRADTGQSLQAAGLAELSDVGQRFIILGDYGSGKSMTLRDIYYRCREMFIAGSTVMCPVYLNLREHIAQVQPDEALFRHSQRIGFDDYSSLIAAWRAGYVTLFLDGFDELTPPQFSVSVSNLKEARRFAVELVKRFFEQTPIGSSIFLAGRESYFDSRDECQKAMGYGADDILLELSGFTDEQVAKYLGAKRRTLPDWLPTRPLLLGYLANSGLIGSGEDLGGLTATAGWNLLLNKICEREVNQVWGVGFDPQMLRLFIESLASRARRYSGAGKLLEDSDLRLVFHTVFGKDADEPASLLASRLPGLGAVPGRNGAREFIDADFADVAGGGDLGRFVSNPFVIPPFLEEAKCGLGALAHSFVVEMQGGTSRLSIALYEASKYSKLGVTAADLISILVEEGESYKGDKAVIQGADFEVLTLDDDVDLSRITFKNCIFSRIEIGRSGLDNTRASLPTFEDCVIGRMDGVVSRADLPDGIISGNTAIEKYSAYAGTNSAVMESSLSTSVKVLVTILRKLFLQRGAGRQYRALTRGLPANSAKLVPALAGLIKSTGFAQDVTMGSRVVLVPNRGMSAEALSIINGPNISAHPLIRQARSLGQGR